MEKSDKRIDVLMKQLKPSENTTETILSTNSTSGKTGKKSDDIVIICPVRTAIGRAGKGNFRNTPSDKLLEPVFRHILETTKIDPSIVGDIVIGKVLEDGSMGATQVRVASLLAGFPDTVPCTVVNRQWYFHFLFKI
jgi:acetyl-CoA acyltransferase 1